MPGVLIVEANGVQVGGMLADAQVRLSGDQAWCISRRLTACAFRRPVVPGDQVRFEVEVLQVRGGTFRTRGEAFVGGKLVCEAEMMATVRER